MTKQSKALVVVAALALAAVFVMLRATRFGIGVLPDSTIYFDAARNAGYGNGLVVLSGTNLELVPLTHYPPLYPLLLALGSVAGATVETSARWLNTILFALNLSLVGLSVAFWARHSFWLPVTAAFLALTAPDLLAYHSVALTEPLYLALTFGGLLSLAVYLQNQRRGLLMASATLMALSVLTRFVGVAGVGAGVAALLFLDRAESGRFCFRLRFSVETRKILDSLIFAVVAGAPIALWAIRNRLAGGGVSDRQLSFHPVKPQQIVSAFSTSAQWFLLGKIRLDFRALGFIVEVIVLTILTAYVLRTRGPDHNGSEDARAPLPQLLSVFMCVYVSFLIFVISFIETDIVLDSRSLLPVHFALLILAPCLAGSLYRRASGLRGIRIMLVVAAVLLSSSYLVRGARWLAQAQGDAQGYVSRQWQESGTLVEIRKLPAQTRIYSNGVDAIYYLTGRRALNIPAKMIRVTGQPNPHYEAELQRMSDDLRQHQGRVVYFNNLPERWFLPMESELKSRLPLTELSTATDGTIYGLGFDGPIPQEH